MGGLVETREMDGHHRLQRHSRSRSSRCRDRSYLVVGGGGGGGGGGQTARKATGASDLKPGARDLGFTASRARIEGNDHYRSYASDFSYGSGSPIEENSFTLEFRRNSSKRASGTPIKVLIDEEMSREAEIRRPSPSVIARLMGLDTLPHPRTSYKQQKEVASRLQKKSSVGFQASYESEEDHWHRTSTSDHQEFKDVYEIMESSEVEERKNQSLSKEMQCSKRHEKELDFIRQKFIDAKRLSTDETLQNSKELHDALEILESNKDLFLKCLHEPNSLFAKHIHDLKCFSPSPEASHITILKSSKSTNYESSEACKLERKAERHDQMVKDVISSLRSHTKTRVVNSLQENNSSHSRRLTEQQYLGKTGTCPHPTRIVVLKPSLESVQVTARTGSFPRSPENLHFGFKKQNGFASSGIQELHGEGGQRHKLFDSEKVMKIKGSREIAREVTKQMRRSVSSSGKKVLIPLFGQINRDGNSHFLSGMSSLHNSEPYQQTLDDIDDWKNNCRSSSLYYSESSMSREARKRLSERWKMTQRFHSVGLSGNGSSTLGEMLALSDTETPRTSFGSSISQKFSDEKSVRDDVFARQGCPCGISSQDGWKDGSFINLLRSASLPASSTVYGSPKSSSRHSVGGSDNCHMLKDPLNVGANDQLHGNFNRRRSSRRSFKYGGDKSQSFSSVQEVNKLPVQMIHVQLEEKRNTVHVNNLAGDKPFTPTLSDSIIANARVSIKNMSLNDSVDAQLSLVTNEEKVQQPVRDSYFADNDHNDKFLEVTSCDHLPEDSVTSQFDRTESGSPASSSEVGQPSPVSVLEPQSEEDKSSSTCFERISADLHELRMQLQLLKLETEDTFVEEPDALLTDDDTGADHKSVLQLGEIEFPFKDDAQRDFSYLLDILVGSGIYGANKDRLFDACYLPECPVDPSVFEKLEKKYGVLATWSSSERKLLFGHINSTLANILAPCMDLHPWVKWPGTVCTTWVPEGLDKVVWQIVVRQQKELRKGNPEDKVLDSKWLELADDVDMIGREIERMLKDELLEELVSEFVSR